VLPENDVLVQAELARRQASDKEELYMTKHVKWPELHMSLAKQRLEPNVGGCSTLGCIAQCRWRAMASRGLRVHVIFCMVCRPSPTPARSPGIRAPQHVLVGLQTQTRVTPGGADIQHQGRPG
jgi:hypothetical protein